MDLKEGEDIAVVEGQFAPRRATSSLSSMGLGDQLAELTPSPSTVSLTSAALELSSSCQGPCVLALADRHSGRIQPAAWGLAHYELSRFGNNVYIKACGQPEAGFLTSSLRLLRHPPRHAWLSILNPDLSHCWVVEAQFTFGSNFCPFFFLFFLLLFASTCRRRTRRHA